MKRTILITGATDGIGKQTAFRLAQLGHRIIMHGRNVRQGKKLRDLFRKETNNKYIEYVNADLTSFSDIEGLVEVLVHRNMIPDILINNAGVFQSELELVTDHKIEKTFMINYLAPFYLSYLLIPIMEEQNKQVIVNVSSMIHASHIDLNDVVNPTNFDSSKAYGASKLGNILFTKKMAREKPQLKINAVHPGVIDTKLFRSGWGGGGSDLNAGADQLIFAALELPQNTTGKYFEYSNEAEPAEAANDTKLQDELYDLSMKLIPKSS